MSLLDSPATSEPRLARKSCGVTMAAPALRQRPRRATRKGSRMGPTDLRTSRKSGCLGNLCGATRRMLREIRGDRTKIAVQQSNTLPRLRRKAWPRHWPRAASDVGEGGQDPRRVPPWVARRLHVLHGVHTCEHEEGLHGAVVGELDVRLDGVADHHGGGRLDAVAALVLGVPHELQEGVARLPAEALGVGGVEAGGDGVPHCAVPHGADLAATRAAEDAAGVRGAGHEGERRAAWLHAQAEDVGGEADLQGREVEVPGHDDGVGVLVPVQERLEGLLRELLHELRPLLARSLVIRRGVVCDAHILHL
mmetsp:Transcript_89407/g.248737  ORF Transcript_89407/g.248737 Transcript_89407/m.248737 type:complete len:308 (-) Transcript_89407:312-1235(-)